MKEYYTAQDQNEEKRFNDNAKIKNSEYKDNINVLTEFIEANADSGLKMPPHPAEPIDTKSASETEKAKFKREDAAYR